jgi:hypothetical protein
MPSESETKQKLWETVLGNDVPRLAGQHLTVLQEFAELYKTLAQGPGDWTIRQIFRSSIIEANSRLTNVQAETSKTDIRYLGIEQGKTRYIQVDMGIYLVDDQEFSYIAPQINVKELWENLTNRVDQMLRSAHSTRNLYEFAAAICYFRVMTKLIKPYEDAHTRTLNAWAVLQFQKVGYKLDIPLHGKGFNIPEDNPVKEYEIHAILDFMERYKIPFYYNGRYYDLMQRPGETKVNLHSRILDISNEEYHQQLVRAVENEINSPNRILAYAAVMAQEMMNWLS